MKYQSYIVVLFAVLLLFFGLVENSYSQQPVEPGDEQIQEAIPADESDSNKDETKKEEVKSKDPEWLATIDSIFGKYLVTPLYTALFFSIVPESMFGAEIPFVVVWLLLGAIFFTLRYGFINFRAFGHALKLVRGDYDNPSETGEVTHFQALSSALSATVGLGNIAGVAIAVGQGGPGAIFWMIIAGFIGMSSKFAECTLGQMYRKVAPDGTVSGGPMRYLLDGFAELHLKPVGVVLSILFTILCIGGSFGGGCAFQVVQSMGQVIELFPGLEPHRYLFGIGMAICVGIVIIGGIRRIASTAEKIVPLMCGIYLVAALFILLSHFNEIPQAFALIFNEAFSAESIKGGLIGVMVVGITRAAFSNEAGVGSAAIAHAAAKTEYPIREGIVASLGPFIDTVIICTMTGLVIVITNVCGDPNNAELIVAKQGATLTSRAFESVIWFFPYILCVAVVLFAYSTMISWSYYGERCWSHLFGERFSLIYRIMFLGFVVLGSIVSPQNILDFSDLMILTMAFPNILGVVVLSGKVKRALDDYWTKYKAGEFKTYTNK